jgi:type VI secretion system secreted protein VgrG
MTAGQHLSLSVGKRFLASAMQGIRLFAQSMGIKMFAAKGKVEIQAQSDNIEIIADQVLKLISAKKSIEIAAAEEILLTAGGSYYRMGKNGIEQGTLEGFTVYSASQSFNGPRSFNALLPRMGVKNYLELNLHWPDLEPAVGAPYYLAFANGAEITGKLDEKGYARIDNPPDQEYEAWFGEDARKAKTEFDEPEHSNMEINAELTQEQKQAIQAAVNRFTEGGFNV